MADAILFGGANTEEIIVLKRPFKEGDKVPYHEHFDGVGGSAVNWSFWLHAAGFTPLLYCPIGNDERGDQIRSALQEIDMSPNPTEGTARSPVEDHTRHSYIIVHEKEKRTVLSDPTATGRWLTDISEKIKGKLRADEDENITMAMIGNIPSETEDLAKTLEIITALKDHRPDIFIYVNMGRAQREAGFQYWEKCLEQVDVFQFGLEEAKAFVKSALGLNELPRLDIVIEQFVEWNTNVIITLGRGGAVSVFPRKDSLYGRLFFTWPICAKVEDPTGSGDAFGAGFVAAMLHLLSQNVQVQDLLSEDYATGMLDTAGKFASEACKKYGGSTACPKDAGSMRQWLIPSAGDAKTTCARKRHEMNCALYALDRP